MLELISGKCLCGRVKFELENQFKHFYICHCEQCRKTTGSAFAANLFGSPEQFRFTSGANKIKRFDHDKRGFTKAFCTECGSGIPYLNSTGEAVIVPAGSLDAEPQYNTKNFIFHSEKISWSEKDEKDSYFDGFPT
jgi:hypothetical protein